MDMITGLVVAAVVLFGFALVFGLFRKILEPATETAMNTG